MICTPGKQKSQCESKEEAKKRPKQGCGIYDPNCDNSWNISPSYSQGSRLAPRGGVGIGFSKNPDGSSCILVGPFFSPTPFSYSLGDLFE